MGVIQPRMAPFVRYERLWDDQWVRLDDFRTSQDRSEPCLIYGGRDMPSKYRNYFTAAEIARAFDVPVDKIEAVAGKRVYLNQIGDVREAVLSVH